jgi:ornithine cyclodeaminase/alanine dehydrogenase-like protein (mu-crystallin family)
MALPNCQTAEQLRPTLPDSGRQENETRKDSVNLPFISEEQVREVLSYHELIPLMRRALMDYSAGRVLQPLRTVLSIKDHNGWFALMPAAYGNVMGAKMVTFYPGNAGSGDHTHQAVIQLFRADNGEPIAVIDGRLITEMRTAAVSAVAVDLLARREKVALAILGSGVQARSHFKALSLVRALSDIRVWSRTQDRAQKFADEIGARTATSVEEAVSGADVVLTLTSSPVPILFGRWLKKDALVCAVGAVTPDRRELDDECMQGPVIVECREAGSKEPGDILLAGAQITAELGELLNGAKMPATDRPTIFKSVGIAIEDIASARLVYDKLSAGG